MRVLALSHAQMSVHQTKKSSDLEKRLRILSQQLYGKKDIPQPVGVKQLSQGVKILDKGSHHEAVSSSHSDIVYLRKDLTKIFIFSGLALIIELAIYFSQLYSKIRIF